MNAAELRDIGWNIIILTKFPISMMGFSSKQFSWTTGAYFIEEVHFVDTGVTLL